MKIYFWQDQAKEKNSPDVRQPLDQEQPLHIPRALQFEYEPTPL